ncbi:MAG TPA: pyridoxamine 5'-phosphate oxidase family protein [Bacteroidales bacterium]|nr:pyridoxamine 5'-phosphate oxidase family protein [Bacteroidales bacterium]
MNQPEPRILDFIREHHIFTLAVSRDGQPWCATCFYIYDAERNLFVFTSGEDTRHIKDMTETGHYGAAGAIALETKMTGKIRGIQFTGRVSRLEGPGLRSARKQYVSKFPVAQFTRLTLWGLEPDMIKMTDNRLGFGKKIIWKAGRPEEGN